MSDTLYKSIIIVVVLFCVVIVGVPTHLALSELHSNHKVKITELEIQKLENEKKIIQLSKEIANEK